MSKSVCRILLGDTKRLEIQSIGDSSCQVIKMEDLIEREIPVEKIAEQVKEAVEKEQEKKEGSFYGYKQKSDNYFKGLDD